MDIKLAITIIYKDSEERAGNLYFSTDLKQAIEKIVHYFQACFQTEFMYRNAGQFTGLTFCQSKDETN